MKQWLGLRLAKWSHTLTRWSLAVRGLKGLKAKTETVPTVKAPRLLGPFGQAISDSVSLMLEAMHAIQGHDIASDAAAGYADAADRYSAKHGEVQ